MKINIVLEKDEDGNPNVLGTFLSNDQEGLNRIINKFDLDEQDEGEYWWVQEAPVSYGQNHVYTLSGDEIREMAEDEHGELTDEEVEKIISTLNSPKCSSMTDYVEAVIDTCIAFARE